ncbi:MAG: hypothetical protein HY963_09540 [Ignavibacteriales bacterium]|nr:hypothetical protein [Ignavibacteriales bacterium]
MKLLEISLFNRIKESKWWRIITYFLMLGVIVLTIILPFDYSDWSFKRFLVETARFIWPLTFLVSCLSFIAAHHFHKEKCIYTDDPYQMIMLKCNKLEEAYSWMRGAAVIA